MAALSAGIVANYGADSSFDVQEFTVVYSGDTLTVTNNEGRALAIEYFSSTDGNMTVTPTNEPGAAAILASQMLSLRDACQFKYRRIRTGLISNWYKPILACC